MTKKMDEPKSPLQEFLDSESASGVLLIIVTVLALIIANSPLGHYYFEALHAKLGVGVAPYEIKKSILHWINDGLMAIFFLLIGLEIKRELRFGELSTVKSALLPVVAAVGGAVLPAVIFISFNAGTVSEQGWAIPMATDIAFAVGILSLLGSKVPSWAKVFLTALAVVDDLIAVLIIAIFYTADINLTALLVAGISILALVTLNWRRVNSLVPYILVGVVLWVATLKSGVHATIAGVILGFAIPATRFGTEKGLLEQAERGFNLLKSSFAKNATHEIKENREAALNYLDGVIVCSESPLHRLEHKIHKFVGLFVMPLFAFANAGLVVNAAVIDKALTSELTLGIVLGLIVGKQLGVFGFTTLLAKFGLAELTLNKMNMKIVYGLAGLAGIGFTMSLFISGLSFGEGTLLELSKVGILGASLLSGVFGFLVLKNALKDA
jgi:NhaA family Na+:H+ antiporter